MFAPGGMPRLPGAWPPEVGEDVAEQVARHHHVERLRVRDEPRRQRVDVILPHVDVRVLAWPPRPTTSSQNTME